MLDDLTGAHARAAPARGRPARPARRQPRRRAARWCELVERYGLDDLREAMDATLDYAERRTRAAIEELGDGERSATDVLEARDGATSS